jgi:replication factor A1
LADRVVFTDVEIQDGWQDDLEASANWRSTVSVLDADGSGTGRSSDGPDADAADATNATSGTAADAGLDAFADSAEADDEAEAVADGDGSATATADSGSAEDVEFTGTVVQTGDPVVLDDGERTKSVETGASLRLGEEITVRGPERDGTIHAEDVF